MTEVQPASQPTVPPDSRSIKVLLVGPWLTDPGGVAVYYNSVIPRITNVRIRVQYLGIGSSEKKRRVIHKFYDQVRYWRSLRSFDPDIVHVNPQLDLLSFFRDGLFVLVAKLTGKTVVVFYHGWRVDFEKIVSRYLKWYFTLTYGRADLFLVLANRFAVILKYWGVSSSILRHHTVVDDALLENFSLERKLKAEYNQRTVRILYLSRLVPDKGLPEFLEAIRIMTIRGLDFEATIAGDGPLMSHLLAEAKELQLQGSRIRIVGHVEGADKISTFASNQIFCFPTRYPEGMPTTIVEAMAFGLAIVTCPAGGIADVFEDRKMGILVQTCDPHAIADAIEKLISDRELLRDVAQYNHSLATRHYLASDAAMFIESVYQKLIPL